MGECGKRRATAPITLHTFTFGDITLRGFLIEGTAWFPGIDPCKALDIKTPHMAYSRLRPEHRTMRSRAAVGLGHGRDIVFINESGLYDLIMRSDKPQAQPFSD